MNTAEELYSQEEEWEDENEENEGPWPFSEAPPEVQEAAIGKNIDINTDHEWWDCSEEELKEDMAEKGICVDDAYFSGFSSQGDGACFEGSVDDMDKFMDAHFNTTDFPAIRQMLKMDGSLSVTSKHTGHYCHSNSVSIDVDAEDWERLHDYDEDDIRFHMLQIVMVNYDDEVREFGQAVEDVLRGYMDSYYKSLEAEYDYLTSDEAIRGTMESAEYTIDVDGDIV